MMGAVLVVVAILVIIFAAITMSRTNAYEKGFEGVDLVQVADWSSTDNPNSGASRKTGIQNWLVVTLVAELILLPLLSFVMFKLYGVAAAVITAVGSALWLAYTFGLMYYMGSVGKNRVRLDNGEIENDEDIVDVNHTFFSLVGVTLVFTIIHAIVAGAFGIYFVVKRKVDEKVNKVLGVESITGAGRGGVSCSPMQCTEGAGRRYWSTVAARDAAARAH